MEVLIGVLATYSLTLILTSSAGPFGIFARLRSIKILGALRCYLCASCYIAGLVALYTARDPLEWLIMSLAYVGGANAIDRLTMGRL